MAMSNPRYAEHIKSARHYAELSTNGEDNPNFREMFATVALAQGLLALIELLVSDD